MSSCLYFNDFTDVEIEKKHNQIVDGKWDFEKSRDFLYDLIHESGIVLNYHGRGTEGSIEYSGLDNKSLCIFTTVFGESDKYDVDDDEYWDDAINEGEDHMVEID